MILMCLRPRYFIIKISKVKGKEVFKVAREKLLVTDLLRLSDFLTQTLWARKERSGYKVLKENSLPPRILYPGKLSLELKEKEFSG